MAGVLRILFVVLCPLVLSQSGDDDWSEKEVVCTSTLTLKQSNLTCSLNDEPTEEVKSAALCQMKETKICKNATLGRKQFTFGNLYIIGEYTLEVNTSETVIVKPINLEKIVKIPAPEIKLATYMEDREELFIWFEHSHDYVSDPIFEVEIWGDTLAKKINSPEIYNRNFTINKERLGGDGVYHTRVKAKPFGHFNGDWSEWSSNASLIIKPNLKGTSLSLHIIIIGFTVFLVFIFSLGALLCRTHIKGYIKPNIPHPKATLAQMHKGLPFTFSPEIFSDVFIHRVDYIDEKPSAPELEDDLDECCYSQTCSSNESLSELDMNGDEQLPREQSHLKIRLLDESDLSRGRQNSGCQGVTAPQRECKDEAYVTMSSLFKTQ